jgi:hypothetical protein
MLKKTFLFLFIGLGILHAEWFARIAPCFYADNTEFFNEYRTGCTYLGNNLSFWVESVAEKKLSFGAGIFADAWYGDQPMVQNVSPLLRLIWSEADGKFQFVFGTLINSNNHGLLDILYSEEYAYLRPLEYGFQIRQNWRHFTQDFWINWNLLNTPAHREYFDFGTRFSFPLPYVTPEIQTYVSHHGGQLFHNGPVSDNLALAVGFDNHFPWHGTKDLVLGWKPFYVTGRNVVNRAVPGLTTSGNGFLVEVYAQFSGFRLYGDYWIGNGFVSEEGNPLYRNDSGYAFFGIRKEHVIVKDSLFYAELRGHVIKEKLEYQYNFGFKANFTVF